MKIIVTGASGFVGSEIIRQCLQNPKITTVVAVARRPVSVPDGTPASKFRSVVVPNYDDYPEDALEAFSGANACIWTVAVTPAKTKGMSPEDVRKGETENQVLRFADQHEGFEACVAKPGFITSYSTAVSSAAAAALSVTVVIPNIDVETIAAALMHQAVAGFEQETLRTSDLKRLGRAAGKIE
ncbi:hypothetical protein ACHAP6_004060 [Verticillium nonalfalfae]